MEMFLFLRQWIFQCKSVTYSVCSGQTAQTVRMNLAMFITFIYITGMLIAWMCVEEEEISAQFALITRS